MAKKQAVRNFQGRGLQHASQIISEVLARAGFSGQSLTQELDQLWREIVGPPLHQLSRVVKLSRGKLEVLVAHSTALQELTFRKQEILQKLQQRWTQKPIRDLKLRVGRID